MSSKWKDAGPVSDFPENFKTARKFGNYEVLIYRKDNEFYAFERHCPHQSRPLDDATVKGEVMTCLYHALEMDIKTGEIVFDGGYINLPELQVFPVKVEDDRVYVWIDNYFLQD